MKKTTTPATPKTVTAKPVIPTQLKTGEQTKVTRPSPIKEKIVTHLFDKENYKWMLAGLIVIAIGFILMAGGKSSSPNVFQDKDVYSFRRITIAPILIIAGFIIEIFAIMRKSSVKDIV
ncbi:MAG: DUF3098 domain-containing protein [Ginsengibacter sp.]